MPDETNSRKPADTASTSAVDPLTKGFDFSQKVPDGDEKERSVCDTCGWIHYVNPKIVVGSVIQWEDRILLARRSIQPRKGYWTLPAGFMEERETTRDGAKREAREETCAEIDITSLLAVYDVPHISQVQIMFLADLKSPDIAPGIESLEVALFRFDEIPWDELAFPSVVWALRHFDQVRDEKSFVPFQNPDPADEAFRFRL
jgi:ADP-ribose pyrophosphatase YjhB (NUDIX family)